MLFNLLTEASGNGGNNAGSWIMVGVLFLFLVAFLIYSNYSQKKRQKETIATLNAIKPGNKVKTIGGICGVFLIPCFYALKLEVSVGAYKCKNCGHEIVPTYKEAMMAMHMGTTRYLKCPKCHKKAWQKKVINKD